MVEQDSIELVWDLDVLDDAIDIGYPDAVDLKDLADYIVNPTYENAVALDLEDGGTTSTTVRAGNWVRLTVKNGTGPFDYAMATPVGGELNIFDDVQQEVDVDESTFSDEEGSWAHTMRVRHWWNVVLEEVPNSVLATRYINDVSATESIARYEYIYEDSSNVFARLTHPGIVRLVEAGGREAARMRGWTSIWGKRQDICDDWVRGHLRAAHSSRACDSGLT